MNNKIYVKLIRQIQNMFDKSGYLINKRYRVIKGVSLFNDNAFDFAELTEEHLKTTLGMDCKLLFIDTLYSIIYYREYFITIYYGYKDDDGIFLKPFNTLENAHLFSR